MSSKQEDGFEAFLRDGMESFGNLNLDEQPSSQEVWLEMLEEIEAQKPVENVFTEDCREMDNLHEIMDVLLEATGKSEEHTAQTLSYIANPKNEKSKNLHARCQLMHLNYCKERSERSASTEVCLCNYFTMLYDTNRYSPGAFWCMCITLRVHISCTHGVNIKTYIKLKTLIKKFTIDHVKNKKDVFSHEEMHKGLTVLFLDSNSKDAQHKIGKHCEFI